MNIDFGKLTNHPVYTVMVEGFALVAHPGVFAPDPRYSNSTGMMLRHLPDLHGKDVLDLGCGTGVMSVIAAKRGARRIVAADIDPAALRNTQENIRKHNLEPLVETIISDLFSHVTGVFDCILANLPIWDDLWNVKTTTQDMAREFLKDVGAHCKPGGTVLLAWFSISPVEPLREALAMAGFPFEEWTEQALGFTWYTFVLHKKM